MFVEERVEQRTLFGLYVRRLGEKSLEFLGAIRLRHARHLDVANLRETPASQQIVQKHGEIPRELGRRDLAT